jgi:hypothetical protein
MFNLHDVFLVGFLSDHGLLGLDLPVFMCLLQLQLPVLDDLMKLLFINDAHLETTAHDWE